MISSADTSRSGAFVTRPQAMPAINLNHNSTMATRCNRAAARQGKHYFINFQYAPPRSDDEFKGEPSGGLRS